MPLLHYRTDIRYCIAPHTWKWQMWQTQDTTMNYLSPCVFLYYYILDCLFFFSFPTSNQIAQLAWTTYFITHTRSLVPSSALCFLPSPFKHNILSSQLIMYQTGTEGWGFVEHSSVDSTEM